MTFCIDISVYGYCNTPMCFCNDGNNPCKPHLQDRFIHPENLLIEQWQLLFATLSTKCLETDPQMNVVRFKDAYGSDFICR